MKRIISLFISTIILLSMAMGLSGCATSGFGETKVVANKEAKIGSLKKDGWSLSIPPNAFDQDVTVSVTKVESGEAYEAAKDSFVALPIDIGVEGMENVRLYQPVKITMKLDEKDLPDNESFDRTVIAYWNGGEWEPIFPDPVRLSEGVLEFETWHFSSYGGQLMTRDEQLRLYAREMATADLLHEKVNKTLSEKITAVVTDYFNGMQMYDKAARDAILKRVQESTGLGAFFCLAEQGDSMEEVTNKVVELITESTVEMCQENPLVLEAISAALGNVGDAIEATAAIADGNYQKAYGELLSLGTSYLGMGGVGTVKSLVELSAAAVEQGIIGWKKYELESAYKAYYGLVKDAYGYKLNAEDWETFKFQMKGYYNWLLTERKKAYKESYGKDSLSKAEEKMLEEQVDGELKAKLEERARVDKEIDAKQAEYEIIIQEWKNAGLFNRTEYGFQYDMTIEQRLHSLFRIRKMIIDMVGGDISVFGSEKKREENLAWAIKMWLGYGKDRTKFYAWMREQGYLKKAGEATEGYWQLVRSFENDYPKSVSDEAYAETWSGGGGSYTYRCEVTYDGISYIGKTHDSCKGEFVENTGTATAPKDRYQGGEQVEIELKITASTSSSICFHLGASLGASITTVNKDDPFVNYGTDTSLYDITEKITKSYIQTGKNDTNTGYWGQSATVGGVMPSGSANGDKVYILIGMGGGNHFITTAYEYEWVQK